MYLSAYSTALTLLPKICVMRYIEYHKFVTIQAFGITMGSAIQKKPCNIFITTYRFRPVVNGIHLIVRSCIIESPAYIQKPAHNVYI